MTQAVKSVLGLELKLPRGRLLTGQKPLAPSPRPARRPLPHPGGACLGEGWLAGEGHWGGPGWGAGAPEGLDLAEPEARSRKAMGASHF